MLPEDATNSSTFVCLNNKWRLHFLSDQLISTFVGKSGSNGYQKPGFLN
jgi:hypothetical protein